MRQWSSFYGRFMLELAGKVWLFLLLELLQFYRSHLIQCFMDPLNEEKKTWWISPVILFTVLLIYHCAVYTPVSWDGETKCWGPGVQLVTQPAPWVKKKGVNVLGWVGSWAGLQRYHPRNIDQPPPLLPPPPPPPQLSDFVWRPPTVAQCPS